MILSELAKCVGDLQIDSSVKINHLLTDSRTLAFPEESVFFAIQTDKNDGHKFIQELYHKQMRYFVVSKDYTVEDKLKDAVFLKVENTLKALQDVVAYHRSKFEIPVIAITGSNGKTIVKEWLFQLLQDDFNICRSPRSYNSQIGVPLSVWNLDEKTEMGIFEAGISKPDEMQNLENVIQPKIGIFTHLGDAHQENFINLREKCIEKIKLFSRSEKLIYCSDDLLLDDIVRSQLEPEVLISWGRSEFCYLRLLNTKKKADQTVLSLRVQDTDFDLLVPFTDKASIENALNCITLLLHLGYTPEQIALRIAILEPIEMRLELNEGVQGSLVINDSYSSDIDSIIIALDFLNQKAIDKNLSRTVVFSDVVQGSRSGRQLYSYLSDLLKSRAVAKIIGVGAEISKYQDEFKEMQSYFFNDTATLLNSRILHQVKNEAILVKGSRKYGFEFVSDAISLRKHETTLDVNLDALVANFNYFKKLLKPSTKIMSMVKAFAYGSGSVEIAKTLQHAGCDYLAVAVADEGVELRKEGISLPVVVMNPEQGSLSLLFDFNLEPEIYSFELLKDFVLAVTRAGLHDYPIHLKLDTGMHRLGFDLSEIEDLVQYLLAQDKVMVKSVFSHLAAADSSVLDDFTEKQIQAYLEAIAVFESNIPYPFMKHILNSAGTERFAHYQFDMVRLGIGHYGISALENKILPQVCTLKTVVLQVKEVEAGETVGYSRKGIVEHPKKIAILPIGYADGFNRRLSNGVGEVFVNGCRAKVIGNVSMDLTAIDVTGVDVRTGDLVEIFGDNITISEMAQSLGTIPYEILTNVSRRVKRIYYKE